MSHSPVTEDVIPFDCIYGECEHDGLSEFGCPPVSMVVCDRCEGDPYDGIGTFVAWPGEHAPALPNSEDTSE